MKDFIDNSIVEAGGLFSDRDEASLGIVCGLG